MILLIIFFILILLHLISKLKDLIYFNYINMNYFYKSLEFRKEWLKKLNNYKNCLNYKLNNKLYMIFK
jgi:hypothetical protein